MSDDEWWSSLALLLGKNEADVVGNGQVLQFIFRVVLGVIVFQGGRNRVRCHGAGQIR